MQHFIILLAVLFLFTSCGGENDPADSSQQESAVESVDEASEPEEAAPEKRENTALAAIPGFAELPSDALLGVRYYRWEMAWEEVNPLPNLEQYTPLEPNENYFLIIPRYAGADVRVEKMYYDDEAEEWKAGEITYQREDIPDGYALLITDVMPEGGPNKRVVVTYQGESGFCDFTRDNYSGIHPPPWYENRAYMIGPSMEDSVDSN